MKKQYNYQDDFEMLMVRHEYISKVKNPDPNWIAKFEPIVNTTALLMYEKLKPNFSKVGYELDDVKMITNCYMIGYMGLYSLERNESAKQKIFESYNKRFDREPTPQELAKKERINLISFLRQRLQHASTICSRKARNITMGSDKRAAYAFTSESVPASDELIFENGENLGYRKITKNELKDIKLRARVERSKELTDESGFKVIEIEILNDGISEYDYNHLFLDEKVDIYGSSPEKVFIHKEKDKDLVLMKEEFNELDAKGKRDCLRNFIDAFKGNIKYKEELTTARKLLKNLQNVV